MRARTAAVLGAALGALAIGPAVGSLLWRRSTSSLLDRIRASAASFPRTFSPVDLAGLPEPVERYFRRALRDGQPFISLATFEQRGTFRLGAGEDSWRKFEASQYVSTRPPGFVWDARIGMAPLVPIRVRDSYSEGLGSLHAEVLALYTVMDQSGAPALNAGALQRYLAEAVWYPTALLPASGVTWSPIDNRRALATLTDGPTTVSLEFRFTDGGEVSEVFAASRQREVNGRYEPTPWLVRCIRNDEHDGIRIPIECEVEWQLPSGPLPYWRGRITGVRYKPSTPDLKVGHATVRS